MWGGGGWVNKELKKTGKRPAGERLIMTQTL